MPYRVPVRIGSLSRSLAPAIIAGANAPKAIGPTLLSSVWLQQLVNSPWSVNRRTFNEPFYRGIEPLQNQYVEASSSLEREL
jgi:hypothetical protein